MKATTKFLAPFLLLIWGTTNAASLVGSNVTGTLFFPNLTGPEPHLIRSWTVTADEGDTQTFGGINVNVGSSEILYTANQSVTYATGFDNPLGPGGDACNCIDIVDLVWDLNVDPAIVIGDVRIAELTGGFIGSVSEANIFFDTDTVRIDVQGITVEVGDFIRLNVIPTPIPPVIDETATVADDAVIGDGSTVGANTVIAKGVTVGENSTIGANVTINKDTQLGDNTVVGDGSTIHKDVIAGDNLTVGSNVIIHKDVIIGTGVTIGDNTEIHKGTVIGNDVQIGLIGGGVGVFVGNDVTIAASSVIGDGETIPNNTTVP